MPEPGREGRSDQRALSAVVAVLLVSWTLFAYGCLWQYIDLRRDSAWVPQWGVVLIAALFPAVLAILGMMIWRKRELWWPSLSKQLEHHTDAIDAMPESRMGLWITLAAGLTLFAELMIVRLHGSFFQLFAYFKNVSMLSCFLGLGIGYARGSKRPLTTPLALPLLALQITSMHLLRQFVPSVRSFLQNPVWEQAAFGLRGPTQINQLLTVYGFLSLVFAFNALCFVPLGQLVSRLMMRRQKLVSYSWNLVGSLLGIFLFNVLSFLWAPPSLWVLFMALVLMVFLRKHVESLLPSALAAVVMVGLLGVTARTHQFDVYSPYQILTWKLQRDTPPLLQLNNVFFQRPLDLREQNLQGREDLQQWAVAYGVPYYFKSEPGRVLIVGSGSGNDVAAAIRHGAAEIDAVEIDPAILEFGKSLHPESPYQDSRVHAIVNDARAFIRHTDKQYDMIVYGYLDSHTLLSGMSSVRLDSYVYTVEAFREARARLKKDGIVSVGLALLRPESGRKTFLMLQTAFDGQTPIVYQVPVGASGGYIFLVGDGMAERQALQIPGAIDVTADFANSQAQTDMSTDDWPFFYMPVRKYPRSAVVMILILLVISTLFIRQLMPQVGGSFSVPCFFLGAGFMLMETKAITELALVYGNTWIVIGAVIAAILGMEFLANSLVIRRGNPRRVIVYALVGVALLASLFLAPLVPTSLAPWLNRIVMTVLLTLPLFFAGFAFTTELDKSISVAGALSANLWGAMLGGFLEYNAMYFGYRALYLLALAMYGLAYLTSFRNKR